MIMIMMPMRTSNRVDCDRLKLLKPTPPEFLAVRGKRFGGMCFGQFVVSTRPNGFVSLRFVIACELSPDTYVPAAVLPTLRSGRVWGH